MRGTGVRKILARLGEDLVALFYPPQCLWCCTFETVEERRFLCETCWQRVYEEETPALRDWSIRPPTSNFAGSCAFDVAAWRYHGAMSVLIPAMKYRDHPSFAKIFGEIAAQRLRTQMQPLFAAEPILVPVPLHATRRRERGFNQSELIAQTFAKHWNVECRPRALRRVKYTEAQARLGSAQRLQNVSNAFAPARALQLEARTVILVDDVITTGATISACARVLTEAGAARICAAALARA